MLEKRCVWLLRYIPFLYAFLHTSNGFPHIDLSLSDGQNERASERVSGLYFPDIYPRIPGHWIPGETRNPNLHGTLCLYHKSYILCIFFVLQNLSFKIGFNYDHSGCHEIVVIWARKVFNARYVILIIFLLLHNMEKYGYFGVNYWPQFAGHARLRFFYIPESEPELRMDLFSRHYKRRRIRMHGCMSSRLRARRQSQAHLNWDNPARSESPNPSMIVQNIFPAGGKLGYHFTLFHRWVVLNALV